MPKKGKNKGSPPTPGPSKILRVASPDVKSMDVDSSVATVTARNLPDKALSFIADFLPQAIENCNDGGTDTDLNSDDVLTTIHNYVWASTKLRPESLVRSEQFKKNATKERTDFTNVLKVALEKGDLSFWQHVVTHDVFHTVIPDDLTPTDDNRVPLELQEKAITDSWGVPFIGTSALGALKDHVIDVLAKKSAYGPYCSIVQSSGMGKSRLLDEFSKSNFVIPINLRKEDTSGFPPPDNAVRNLLAQSGDSNEVRNRMLSFYYALFEKTKGVIIGELKEAQSQSERITKFRGFMAEGQTRASVGPKREKFYEDVVGLVENRTSHANKDDVKRVLESLVECLCAPERHSDIHKHPPVYVVFDEAHSLTSLRTSQNRTPFTELCSALKDVDSRGFFSFFLSTSSKISQFVVPKHIDVSARMVGEAMPSIPFSDLGFDHLMRGRKIFDEFKTLADVTSAECVVRMGRPLWGTMYDSLGPRNSGIFRLAVAKLLYDTNDTLSSFTSNQKCAVLSQRLALEINSSTYVINSASNSTERNYNMFNKMQAQIANHMHVCIAVPQDLTRVHAVAASEPILSEAASFIMRCKHSRFDTCQALLDVLDSYAISHGERGELLVATLFTRARDLYARKLEDNYELSAETLQCPIFSVMDLLSNLFVGNHFETMLKSSPSVCRAGFSPSKTFQEAFEGKTRMHFSHMIQPTRLNAITRRHLLAFMARGAAAYGANCQRGYDMVYPFMYETEDTDDLDDRKVGFIVVQVKNHTRYMTPKAKFFQKMYPVYCDFLEEDDCLDFTIPIIRIVFAFGGDKSFLEPMEYTSPKEGAKTLDEGGCAQFTSYDFWCSGISEDVLLPVDDDDKWKQLLGKTSKWEDLFSASKAEDVRRSQYPGGEDDDDHYNAWANIEFLKGEQTT